MKEPETFQWKPVTREPQQSGGIDPLAILSLLLKNWYWFVITIIISILGARFYIGHTMPVYRTTTAVLINDSEERSLVNNDELLQGLGLPGGMKNLENQIMILHSRALIEKTLNELPYEIEYYLKTLRNSLPLYPDSPIKVVSDTDVPLPKGNEFSVSFLGGNTFILKSESDHFVFQKQSVFGENIEVPGGSLRIESLNDQWIAANKDQKIYFVIHNTNKLVNYFGNRIEVERVSREGSVLRISMAGTNSAKDADFLNTYTEVFQSISLDKKNTEAIRRIQFIDDQIIGISDSLSLTENKLQQFRSSHKVMDLSAQGQSIITQVTILENERARLSLEANYYDYLADYLSKDVSDEVPIVPITMGITDPGLTRLVSELAELQGQLSTRGAGDMNPLQNLLVQKVRSTKEALRETLNGLRRANSLSRSENQEQILKVNSQASALPVTERQLLGIERKFRINDELYTFLLEKRAELQMQKASNRADSEVIEPADARYSTLLSPNPPRVYFAAMFIGFGLPFLLIFLRFLLNKKLNDEEIRKKTDLPIVGNIPHSSEKTSTVVFDSPNSGIAESYRLLRSRMQFLTKEAKSPVILLTSSMPGEGKTHTAINLASVYSLLSKNTVLVGFDLRKPKIFQDFKLTNEKGVSTWLIGKDSLEDIIQKTQYENLSVISAGPIPPNPSELTALDKAADLIKLLKEKFDYIIIDSSPIGLVSDTFYLASFADATLVVVRPGHSLRDMFDMTLNEIKASGTKGVSLIINDIKSDNKHYGYGDKYGYTNEKKGRRRIGSKKNILK